MIDTILKPETTVQTQINNRLYTWDAFPESITGLRAIRCTDTYTGVQLTVTQAHAKVRVAAHKAWGAARYSRAPGSAVDILNEMGMQGVNSDAKLDQTFRTYGHKSVGDMAQIMVCADNVPNHVPLVMFYLGEINSGQEKSTRFQPRFGEFAIHSPNSYFPANIINSHEFEQFKKSYFELGKQSLDNFNAQRAIIENAYREYYKPESNEKGAFTARVLDTARFLLVLGQNSGFAYSTNARDWSAKISNLQSMNIPFYQELGEHFKVLLSPPNEMQIDGSVIDNNAASILEERLGYKAEAPSLIRHAVPNLTVRDNLSALKNYLSTKESFRRECPQRNGFAGLQDQKVTLIPSEFSDSDRMVAQYITAATPGLDEWNVLKWVHDQSDYSKREMSSIIFRNHECNNEMPQLAATSAQSIIIQSQLGEIRDFNRHRAQGRHLQGLTSLWGPTTAADMDQIINAGYGIPLYLNMSEFKEVRNGFVDALSSYYEQLSNFKDEAFGLFGDAVDWGFMLNVIPMAQQINLWMHSDAKQSAYFYDRRARDGGHINYRDLAYSGWEQLTASDPYLSAMTVKSALPDPRSREQFFSRS